MSQIFYKVNYSDCSSVAKELEKFEAEWYSNEAVKSQI